MLRPSKLLGLPLIQRLQSWVKGKDINQQEALPRSLLNWRLRRNIQGGNLHLVMSSRIPSESHNTSAGLEVYASVQEWRTGRRALGTRMVWEALRRWRSGKGGVKEGWAMVLGPWAEELWLVLTLNMTICYFQLPSRWARSSFWAAGSMFFLRKSMISGTHGCCDVLARNLLRVEKEFWTRQGTGPCPLSA